MNPSAASIAKPVPPPAWEGWAAAVLLGLAAALLVRPSIRGYDGAGHYVYLMSILNDGDLNFGNDYAAFDWTTGGRLGFAEAAADTATGRPANRYGVGPALFWAPLAVPLHWALEALDPASATGLGRPYEIAVGAASAAWGSLGLLLLYLRLRSGHGVRASAGTILALLSSTALPMYLYWHGSLSHAVNFFVAVVALLAWEHALRRPGAASALGLGFWCGMLTITRFQDASWAGTLAVSAAWFYWRERRAAPDAGEGRGGARPRGGFALLAFAAAAGFFAALTPQLAAWRAIYGDWFSGPVPYFDRGGGKFHPWPRFAAAVLFSSRHGALAWHPVLLAAIAGWLLALKSEARPGVPRRLVAAAALGFLAQTLLTGSWSMWYAGASFGNRFFISTYPWFAFGLAEVLSRADRTRAGRIAAAAALAMAALWNAGLLVQYGTGMISREEAPGWSALIANQMGPVPEWVMDKLGF